MLVVCNEGMKEEDTSIPLPLPTYHQDACEPLRDNRGCSSGVGCSQRPPIMVSQCFTLGILGRGRCVSQNLRSCWVGLSVSIAFAVFLDFVCTVFIMLIVGMRMPASLCTDEQKSCISFSASLPSHSGAWRTCV